MKENREDTEAQRLKESRGLSYQELFPPIFPAQFTTLLKWVGWVVLLLLVVNYWLTLFVPFYQEGIYRMHAVGFGFEGGAATEGQIDTLASCLCLGFPLLLLLAADLLVNWRSNSRASLLIKLPIFTVALVTLILSAVSSQPLLLWTFG